MAKRRKLVGHDLKLLTKCVKLNGKRWTYTALAVWFHAVGKEELDKMKRWTRQRLEAYKFLRWLTDDYTFNAIYGAMEKLTNRKGDIPTLITA